MASHLVRSVLRPKKKLIFYYFYRPISLELNKIASIALSTTRYALLVKLSFVWPFKKKSQIGACRHGDRCSRKHIRPPFSQTILLPNVYHNPAHDPVCKITDKELQDGFDAVYEDLYCELAKFGHLLELHVSPMYLLCNFSLLNTHRFAIMLGIIWSGMYTHDTSGRPKHRLLSTIAMNGGMQVW